ncbi:cbb3-type cytochrome c oxidase subunit I [Neptuniibacter sp. PT34_22]|uniref:cbb3-type cytochrome c oxidase subunit I n=1 Tax=Neptuniibacter sp. PT34_22 TaxID=3398205 RepID=UPI0039F5C0E3
MTEQINYSEQENKLASLGIKAYLITSMLVFSLMMLAGVTMRAAQGTFIEIGADLFYQVMTVHGAGMVGTAGLGGTAVLWYFLRKYINLSSKVLWVNFVIFLIGVVLILGSIFVGKFAGAWTFLYPLPAKSMGVWSVESAAVFMLGLLLIGTGFLILYLDIGIKLIKKYGNLGNALGLPVVFGMKPVDPDHPTTVVAATMVLIVNFIGIAAGAVVLVLCLFNLYQPDYELDPLLIKNLIYFFGHVFINATIYSAVTAVYELLPKYTGRPWKVSKPFYYAWAAASLMVMAVYPHHLLMDFVMPPWLLVIGQILSYCSGIPVLAVTAYGALMIVYRSGIKWDLCSSMLLLSMFGWAGGVIPAIIDATVTVNKVMHNTMWVPGHFHFYLVLGLLPMIIGFCSYLAANSQPSKAGAIGKLAFATYFVGAMGLILTFLASGADSVPRRWAVHLPEWQYLSQLGAIAGSMVLIGFLIFTLQNLARLPKAKIQDVQITDK